VYKLGLMDHDFQYCWTREQFHNTYSGLVSDLIGKKVIKLYGVWDQIDQEWFEDAPMLLEFEHGELAINTLSNLKTAIIWNEITHTEKPIWFDIPPEELDWREDLVWKEYFDFGNKVLKRFEIIANDSSVIGVVITTDTNEVGIVDNGDITIGLIDHSLWHYLDEERKYGFLLEDVLDYRPKGKHIEFAHFCRIFNRDIQIGVYPEVDFFWKGERYTLRADLEKVYLLRKHEWETRLIEIEPEEKEFCFPSHLESKLIACDTLAELLDKEVFDKRPLKSVWEELEFIPFDDSFDYRFGFNDWVYVKSIKKYGVVRKRPKDYPEGLFYGVAIEGTDWLKGPYYKVEEDDLEYDERPESIDELRQSYQNYLYRLSH